ncbi:hypothetical protein [Sorangium cellulosum]|nr:hypothetical protein [Sorangium cellulosum]
MVHEIDEIHESNALHEADDLDEGMAAARAAWTGERGPARLPARCPS